MEYYDQGATYEDIRGEVFEHEAYMDAVDKSKCSDSCDFEVMEYHVQFCPLYTDADRRFMNNVQSNLDIARGK